MFSKSLEDSIKTFERAAKISRNIKSIYYLCTKKRSTRRIKIRFKNRKLILAVRTGTTDTDLAREIFGGDCRYSTPVKLDPEVIFDAGAHIGLVSVYYALLYPQARIYSFEPLPENFELLEENIALNSVNITPIAQGLGAREGHFAYYMSEEVRNCGGGTFIDSGRRNKAITLPVTTVKQFTEKEKIDKIDILKMDVEGMEHDLIAGIPNDVLKSIKFITGECHGIEELRVFARLSEFFNIGMNKRYDRRNFDFIAVNKTIVGA